MKSLSVPSHLHEQHKSYQINNVNCYLLGWQYTIISKAYRDVNM